MPLIKQKEPLTDEERLKVQLLQEQEESRLKRQYQILQRDSKRYYRAGDRVRLPRYVTVIKKEHHEILTDLKVARSKAKEDAKMKEKLSSLLVQKKLYDYKVMKERQYIEETEGQIKGVKKDVYDLRAQHAEDIREEESCAYVFVRALEAQENKLEVQVKKFGMEYTQLVKLRDKIRNMLFEREAFLKTWNKLMGRLVLGKTIMMDLIEQATLADEQRVEWCAKLNALRIKAHNDLSMDKENMQTLKMKQEHDQKFFDFFMVKEQKRVMEDLRKKEAIKRQKKREQLISQREYYTNLLHEIRVFRPGNTLETVSKRFCCQDAVNFTYVTCINILVEEMESINDKLGNLHMEIEEKNALNGIIEETQKKRLRDLERQLLATKENYTISEVQVTNYATDVETILKGINGLSKICCCDEDPLLNLLDGDKTISVYNVTFYLQLIERAVHFALLDVYYKDKVSCEKKNIAYSQRLVGVSKIKPVIYPLEMITGSSPCPLCYIREVEKNDRDSPVWSRHRVEKRLQCYLNNSDPASRVHNISKCKLPTARNIMQRKYISR